jgi:hypothetical protein
LSTNNAVNTSLSGQTGAGAFVGSVSPTITQPLINNTILGYSTTVTAAGDTTLIVSSNYQQFFTGTTTQSVIMPVTSTLTVGQSWLIVNNSTGIVTVKSSGLNNIIAIQGGTNSLVTCIATGGTTASDWNAEGLSGVAGVDSITGTANQVIASNPTGAVVLSLPQSIGTTSDVEYGSVAFSDNTKGILGTTTNDAADAGYVGEVIFSQVLDGSPVSLVNSVPKNITSISLTAGDWDVYGNVLITPTVGNSLQYVGISTTTNTLPDGSLTGGVDFATFSLLASGYVAPTQRLSLAAPTTVYLVAVANFSAGTSVASGTIYGRRAR